MRPKIVITLILILAISIPTLIYYTGKNYFSRVKIYELTWQIHIPAEFKEIVHYTDEHGFHGDGLRYTVFEAKEMNSVAPIRYDNKVEEIKRHSGNSEDVKDENIEGFVQDIIAELDVPEISKPSFDRLYIFQEFIKHNDRLVILYFPEINQIYFAEELK